MKWISVKDRLPTEEEADNRLLLRDSFYIDYLTGYYFKKDNYFTDKNYKRIENISHWCEITEPLS